MVTDTKGCIPYIAEYKASPNIRRPVFFQLYYKILPILRI